jgi:hypothetical protein
LPAGRTIFIEGLRAGIRLAGRPALGFGEASIDSERADRESASSETRLGLVSVMVAMFVLVDVVVVQRRNSVFFSRTKGSNFCEDFCAVATYGGFD